MAAVVAPHLASPQLPFARDSVQSFAGPSNLVNRVEVEAVPLEGLG